MKRAVIVEIAGWSVLLAAPVLAATKPAPAKAPPLTACDELAANPYDTEHVGVGVTLVLMDAPAAIEACTAALEQYPDTARFIYQLGRSHDAGGDPASALPLYEQAADAGYVASYSNLGRLYDYGIGVAADPATAEAWYRRGVDAGSPNAMFALSVLYESGDSREEHKAESVALIQKAAELGHPEAVYALGAIYAQGDRGLAQDNAKALELYVRAADLGSSAAAFEVANLYLKGDGGLPQDFAKAEAYFEIAGNGGRAEALYNLGIMKEYAHSGVAPDYVAAADYYHRASTLGDASASYNLGTLYDTGRGVAADHAEAARLVFGAIKGGDPFARAKMAAGATQFTLEFRTELQRLLSEGGLFTGAIDGVFAADTLSALDALAEVQ